MLLLSRISVVAFKLYLTNVIFCSSIFHFLNQFYTLQHHFLWMNRIFRVSISKADSLNTDL